MIHPPVLTVRYIRLDPRSFHRDQFENPSTRAQCQGPYDNVIPIIRQGTIPVDQKPPATVPDGYVPVATLTLALAHTFYSIDEDVCAELVRRGLLTALGDPQDFAYCYTDLESAARAHALFARGRALRWSHAAIDARIRSVGEDDPQFCRILGRFMRCHRWAHGHQPGIVGFHPVADGIDLGTCTNPIVGWQELMDYRKGL